MVKICFLHNEHVSCFCFHLLHFAELRDAQVQYDASHYEKLLDLRDARVHYHKWREILDLHDARVHYHIRFVRRVLFITRAVHETCFCCQSCNGRVFLFFCERSEKKSAFLCFATNGNFRMGKIAFCALMAKNLLQFHFVSCMLLYRVRNLQQPCCLSFFEHKLAQANNCANLINTRQQQKYLQKRRSK